MAWGFDTTVADTSSYGGNGGHPGQGIGYSPSGPTQAGQAGLSRLDNEIWGQRRDMFGKVLGSGLTAWGAQIGKHLKTGAGNSWLPNQQYRSLHPGAPASTGAWLRSGPTLAARFALPGLVGYGSYLGTKGLLNMTGGTEHLRNFGSYLAGSGDQ